MNLLPPPLQYFLRREGGITGFQYHKYRTWHAGLGSLLKPSTVILCRLILNNLESRKEISLSPWKALDLVGGCAESHRYVFRSLFKVDCSGLGVEGSCAGCRHFWDILVLKKGLFGHSRICFQVLWDISVSLLKGVLELHSELVLTFERPSKTSAWAGICNETGEDSGKEK